MSSLRSLSPLTPAPGPRPVPTLPAPPSSPDQFESSGALPKIFSGVGIALGLAGLVTIPHQAQVQLQPAPDTCAQQCYTNAVLPKSAPDPGVIQVGDQWYLTHTGRNAEGTFPLYQSSDMVHWQEAGALFPPGQEPEWAQGQYWAPESHQVGDQYVAYFNALEKDSGRLRIGAAVSDRVDGDYRDIGHPLVRNDKVSLIDPTFFRDQDGSQYLYWKENGNAQGEPSKIMAAQVAPDGLQLDGKPQEVLRNDPCSWEGSVVEGPEVLRHGDRYYLFYAGNNYASDGYAEGVARSDSPLGPFQKAPHPVLQSNQQWQGPGHGSLTRDAQGNDWMIYHAWPGSPKDNPQGRQVLLDRIEWTPQGWPTVASGTPSREAKAPRTEAPAANHNKTGSTRIVGGRRDA